MTEWSKASHLLSEGRWFKPPWGFQNFLPPGNFTGRSTAKPRRDRKMRPVKNPSICTKEQLLLMTFVRCVLMSGSYFYY